MFTKEKERLANEVADLLCGAGFKARVYSNSIAGILRVYLNGYGKDITAYLELDPELEAYCDTGDLHVRSLPQAREQLGLTLRVYTNCKQPPRWRVNRRKQVKHTIMLRLQEVGYYDSEVCKDWQQVIL